MEDVVSSFGPGLTLLMIVVLPFLWSVPMACVASELSSMIPETGGLYRWTRRALGEYWSFHAGWWWTLSLYIDSAVYVALFTNGDDCLVGGLIGVLSGPIAYLVFKPVYHGTTDEALEGSTITPTGGLTDFGAAVEGPRHERNGDAQVRCGDRHSRGSGGDRHGLLHPRGQPKLGPSWHAIGILVTSPRLPLGVGVVMIVGGVFTLWNPAVGGVIVLAGAGLGLVYCYTHEWTRFALLKAWAPAVILAWIAGILAGYALVQSIKAYDEPPVYDEEPAPPSTDSASASA